MPEAILFIVETTDRTSVGAEDGPVVWLERALRDPGERTHVLLKRNAVSYAVRHPKVTPPVERELARLTDKGGAIYVLEEDLAVRDLHGDDLLDGITRLRGSQVPALLRSHERVWQW